MKKFLDIMEENYKNYSNQAILYDETHPEGITYRQIDDLTGRVHTWLKQKNIGKEDFVLINMPRGILPVIALLGVWRAGAAFTIVEENYATERINFIREDCGCKTEINKNNWTDIINCEYMDGYENIDLHDAAYSIYTSGTTGNPKGVLHEYGNIDRYMKSILEYEKIIGRQLIIPKGRCVVLPPLNYIGAIMELTLAFFSKADKMYIASNSTVKDPILLEKFFTEKKIDFIFLSSSFARILAGKTGPYLKTFAISAEPANNLYIEGVDIFNFYSLTEIGYIVSAFYIDKPYEVCPIGKPVLDIKYMLVAEDGKEVAPGEIGELCCETPYVRGYINLPEETAKAFKNGFFYTGDLAKVDQYGCLTILGRNKDIIKINGNRIVPAEIEIAIKNVLGIDWVAVKYFEDEGSHLCAYYTEDIEVDTEKLRQELLKKLPYYMIPSYFIKIDKVPLNPNGKLNKKELPKPDIKDYINEYVAPTNEIEEKLCKTFEKILKLDKVGINDDFYEMGGDSLSSMEVLSICNLPGLNVSEIFYGRTPKKIAKLYNDNLKKDGESIDERNSNTMNLEHPLTIEQQYMLNYQLNAPQSTMYNLFTLLRFDKKQYDTEKIAKALEVTIKNHPALLTIYQFNENGKIIQKYSPDVFNPITVEKISENELKEIKDTLVIPFKIMDSKLYRVRVFETEKSGYMFLDIHHSLIDGNSFKVFMENVRKAYMDMQLEKDYYYLMLDKREKQELNAFYEESKKYFEEKYDNIDWSTYPKIDYEHKENELGKIILPLDIKQGLLEKIEKTFRITKNEFFIVVASLAVSMYNKKENVRISWIYNGRENTQLMKTVGLLVRELPISFKFQDTKTISDIYAEAHEQVIKGIEHSCYPYEDKTDDEVLCFLYQQDIRNNRILKEMNMESIDIRQNYAANESIINIEILDDDKGLQAMCNYAGGFYKKETIKKFLDLFIKIADTLMENALNTDITISEIEKKIEG